MKMHQFNVSDMTCGHCASTITQAVKGADPKAKVEISIPEKRVKVESALSEGELAQHIREAGYSPKPLAA
jgi:copper chaperone